MKDEAGWMVIHLKTLKITGWIKTRLPEKKRRNINGSKSSTDHSYMLQYNYDSNKCGLLQDSPPRSNYKTNCSTISCLSDVQWKDVRVE